MSSYILQHESQMSILNSIKEKLWTTLTKIGMTLFVSFFFFFLKTLHNKLKINMKNT